MQEKRLFDFLAKLPKTEFANEIAFLSIAVPEFVSILGYDKSQLFFEADITWGQIPNYRADALIAASQTDRPWLLIEVKLIRDKLKRPMAMWLDQIKEYKIVSDSEYAVLLSPQFLVILQNHTPKDFLLREYSLEELTTDQCAEIYAILSRPDHLPVEPSTGFTPPPNQIIDTDTFKLDVGNYSQQLKSVFSAETNDEKKKSLEVLANNLFHSIPFLACKYSNLRTASSEIDIVVQFLGSNKLTIFDEFGRYFLVECKNWNISVGATQVRDFIGKIQKARVKLGIVFAKNGISGERDGADAVREIHAAFDKDGLFVIVISEKDLRSIEMGTSFYDILDQKIDKLRFDL